MEFYYHCQEEDEALLQLELSNKFISSFISYVLPRSIEICCNHSGHKFFNLFKYWWPTWIRIVAFLMIVFTIWQVFAWTQRVIDFYSLLSFYVFFPQLCFCKIIVEVKANDSKHIRKRCVVTKCDCKVSGVFFYQAAVSEQIKLAVSFIVR